MNESIMARVHSIQSMGTLDGPGVRFVVFLQGCPLRCGCCHNPDTWDFSGGEEFSPEELVTRAKRFREYFGKTGGVTLSGGEPLCQAQAAKRIFKLCYEEGINTCLDTSGCILNDEVKSLLAVTDRVLLDIKYTSDGDYEKYVGGTTLEKTLEFLGYLTEQGIPTTLRQVIIPTLNDSEENVRKLKKIADTHKNVDSLELLPFRKICQTKYDQMGIDFPFATLPTPSKEQMEALNKLL